MGASAFYKQHKLIWSDVEPVLAAIDSVDDAKLAASDPESFFTSLAGKCIPLLIKMARPKIEESDFYKQHKLIWSDVEPVLAAIDSVDDAKLAASDPESFFTSLADRCIPLLIKMARPKIEESAFYKQHKLVWRDVEPVLAKIQTGVLKHAAA